jgi:hypothetical protein
MAMALYACTFRWIIERINARIKGNSNYASIGILDIFGFENFEVSFVECKKSPAFGKPDGNLRRCNTLQYIVRATCLAMSKNDLTKYTASQDVVYATCNYHA